MTNNPLENIWNEFTEKSRIGHSMESVDADFFNFLTKLLKVLF